METLNNGIVTIGEFNRLVRVVATKIQDDPEFTPDTILALSTGGFMLGVALAKQLNINSGNVVGLPIIKDEHGNYSLDEQLVRLKSCVGRHILVVDEASNRGILTREIVDTVKRRRGKAKSCVLIARQSGIQPDYVAKKCLDLPPKFFWELT